MTRSTTPTPPDTAEAATAPDVAAREAQRRDTQDRRRQLLRRVLVRIAALAIFLAFWWLITSLALIKPLYLPSPSAVWHAFVLSNTDHPIAPGVPRMVKGEQNYYLWEHLIASLQRIGVGVGWAIVFGPILGFVMASFRPIATIIEPYLNFLRALPPLGYIAFPPITIATINGVRGVREERINGALSLGASRLQTITHVVLPSTLPEVISGIRIAVGFAWTTVVAAELNVIGIAAILLDLAIKGVEKILVPWRGKA